MNTNAIDLLSLVLTLRPLAAAGAAAQTPPWWGRAGQSLLLDVIRRADPGLSDSLHEGQGPRPYTVSSLLGHFQNGQLDDSATYTLRLTALRADLAGHLLAASGEGGLLAPGAILQLDYRPFRVEAAATTPEGQPWAATGSYGDLAASALVSGEPPPRQVTLMFTSPTAFKSQERTMPLPLPDLVFGSLLDRWNAFAPVAFPAETKRYAAECLAVSRFELASRPVPAKEGGLRVGAVGQMTYVTLNYDRYWMSVIHTLAACAIFSGAGMGTASGLGQCRQVYGGM
jgi:CRISPR-associated endoribonuclease Cas6